MITKEQALEALNKTLPVAYGTLRQYIEETADLHRQLAEAQARLTELEGQKIVQVFVPVSDEIDKYDNHPNDKELRDLELQDVFAQMGSDIGQGLSSYWKWAFAAGWNAHKRTITVPSPADQKDAEREKLLLLAYMDEKSGEVRSATWLNLLARKCDQDRFTVPLYIREE